MPREFDWDPVKAVANRRKHKVAFQACIAAFDDPFAVIVDVTEDHYDEVRWKLIGRPDLTRPLVLLVVYTERHPDVCRIISARKADPADVDEYVLRLHGDR